MITPLLQDGDNTVSVEVFRWCDGSFLEDQDFWRLSGIYRSVFLTARDQVHVRDFEVKTLLDEHYQDATLELSVELQQLGQRAQQASVSWELLDDAGTTIEQGKLPVSISAEKGSTHRVHTSHNVANPPKWSAESPQLYTLLAAVVIVALTGESAVAARLLTAAVELDGQTVLETKFSDDGTGTPETVWRYLGNPPGWAKRSHIEANAENPLQADLAGELVIRIQHVDRPIVEAKASKLKLVRDDATSDHWYIPIEEVERIAKLNGIAEPSPRETTRRDRFLWIVGGGGVLLVVIIVVFWLKPSKGTDRSPE